MKLTIDVPDSLVGINNEFRNIDLATLDPNIRAVQWDGAKGHIEFNDNKANSTIDSIDMFSVVIAAWNALTPAPLPPPLPLTIEQIRAQLHSLSPAQVRLVLNQFGLLTQVETAIAAGSRELQIEWEFRVEFKRDNVLLNSMATGLGLTDVQLDNMFKVGILL